MALTKVDISLVDNATGFTIVTKVVTVAASKLVIDGVSQDTLTLTEGYTYKFDTSHATLSGHTVSFATAADAAGSTQYTTGVTTNGTPGNAGAYTQIVVAQSAPVLYYYCANHASMGGTTSTPAAVIANKLLAYDGSGNLPAVDGSQLTNVSTATSSASDPVASTNPSGGVGTEWHNTTSGEVYICTDATAGENVWTNVGAGSGDVAPAVYQGTQYGYACGAYSASDVIDKFSYTSDGNATDVGNLTIARGISQGNSSSTYGHVSGGRGGSTYYNTIDRFPFASDTNASDWGDLTDVIAYGTGCSDVDYGYTVGGRNASIYVDVIQRFQFSSNAGASDVGDLTANRQAMTGHSDQGNSYGFVAGGETGPPWAELNIIERFAFASSSNSSDVGDLIAANSNQFRNWSIGPNSSSYGFTIGGNPNSINNIQRFAFASSANATDWADLTTGNYGQAGSSSGTNGYAAGGAVTNTTIEKFPFASQTNATDIGNLSVNRGYTEGNQY